MLGVPEYSGHGVPIRKCRAIEADEMGPYQLVHKYTGIRTIHASAPFYLSLTVQGLLVKMLTAVLLLVANLAATGALVHHLDDKLPVVRFRLLTTFITISSAQLFFYGLWKVFLKPLCFSPFKHLPKPPVSTPYLAQ